MTTSTAHVGAFRMRLALQAPLLTPDDAGGMTGSFVTQVSVWASVRWLSGDERVVAGRPEQLGRYEIITRWRQGVDAGMRFTGAGRTFGIVSAGDPTGNRSRLVCIAEEIAP